VLLLEDNDIGREAAAALRERFGEWVKLGQAN
jgi:hypothetical protein